MVLGIANVNEMSTFSVNVAQTLGEVELYLLITTVNQAYLTITDRAHALHRLFIDDDKSIIGRIRYDYQILGHVLLALNTQNLRWVLQVLRSGIFGLNRGH